MSFSNDIKIELSQLALEDKREAEAEFLAFFLYNSQFLGEGDITIHFLTEHNASARRALNLIRAVYDKEERVLVHRGGDRGRKSFEIIIRDKDLIEDILRGAYIDRKTLKIDQERFLEKLSYQDLEKAFLRGAFLGSGSLSNPNKSYNLQILSEDDRKGVLLEVMDRFDLSPKTLKKSKKSLVYLKDSDKIADFLSAIGAHKGLLKFEEVRVIKDVKNQTVRMVNCDNANLNKTVNASMKQSQMIRNIDERKGKDYLPQNLRQIADLRLENPDASLKEIGEMMEPKLSKSGVNHRFKKIKRIYEDLNS